VKTLISLLAVCSLLMPGAAMATEEPEFEVIERHEDYEIRRYAPYIVAEVTVDGPMKEAGNKAFRILADYIFGSNTDSTKMKMTAPVESQSAASGTRMKMTAPVISEQAEEGGDRYRYAFVIESKYDLDSVPKPLNEQIALRRVEERVVAAIRFSGSWRESNFDEHREKLLAALARDGIEPAAEPYNARYNAPFVPTFFRRNEVIVEIVNSEGPVSQ
jgi:hypothetical protein